MSTPFYPPLSRLLDAKAIPGDFQALEDLAQDGIDAILDKVLYKDLVTDISDNGVVRHYSITILTKELKLPIFGSGMNLVFFHGSTSVYSEFPIIIDWRWELYKYIARLEDQGFSYLPDAFVDVLLELADIDDINDFIGKIVNVFLDDGGSGYLALYTSLVAKLNEYDDGSSGVGTEITNIENQLSAIEAEVTSLLTTTSDYSIGYLFEHYQEFDVLNTAVSSIQASLAKLIDEYHVDLDLFGDLIRAVLSLTSDLDEKFDKLAKLFESWFDGITKDDFLNLIVPQFSVELDNINAALEFPRDWLLPMIADTAHPGSWIEDPDTTHLAALVFTVGKLKFSTKKGFELEQQSTFSFDPAMIGKTGIILEFQGLKVDMSKAYNIPEADADGRPEDFMGMYAEKASVTLPAKWFNEPDGTNAEIYGEKLLIGTGGLSGTIGLKALGGDNMFWVKLGDSDGFQLGFSSFDISFKQNKVISSNIAAAMKISSFVYPQGDPHAGQIVSINVTGHIHDDGDFNLTASTDPPFPIEFKDVFVYHIRSLEMGEQDDKFYLGTSGKLEFLGFLKDVLNLDSIEVDKLRIYSDGSIEFEGGSIKLVAPIVLPLGPVEITVTAIHYGSHQKDVDGVTRKFNYFGFDGGISVDPLGIEVRGDGVKFYYCTDDLPNPPAPYLHIQTLAIDLVIPATTPAVVINGWVSIPEPGVSPEYAGGIKIQIPQAKIAASADMKLIPRYPAFIIDASVDLPAPIPIGQIGLFGFRGLIGYRYVAEKEAIGLVSGVDTWFDYYKHPPRGIHVTKFSGPDRTKTTGTPFSIGAGASIGTMPDNGTILNIKAMVLLSIPSLFMIDGRAAVLSARLGLETTTDPPFFAFIAVGDNSLELGFGADFKMPTKGGEIITLFAEVQAAFFFKDASKWYVNFGTKDDPITAKIIVILTIKSYLMISAKGIEAGARGELGFKRKYGPIKVDALAYIELGGKISFERPQFGAYMAAGVGANIDIKVVSLYASFDVLFSVEGAKPFKIYGEFKYCVKISIFWVFSFSFCGNLSVSWEFNSDVDRTPVNPMLNATSKTPLTDLVKAVNMLSNETFDLVQLGANFPANLPATVLHKIIPLDTYIDIKTEKGLLPNAVSSIIGGVTSPPTRYQDLVPPDKIIRGKEVRQVIHQYSVLSVEIKSWNSTTSSWQDYHPWKALNPADSALDALRAGQFQKSDGQYNTIRVLATSPFSYTEQGMPNWYIPEQYGLTPGTLFCEGKKRTRHCADFLSKPLGHRYYCPNRNSLFYSHEVAFLLLDHLPNGYAEIVNEVNRFKFRQSLEFQNDYRLQIRLPEPSVEVSLLLSSTAQRIRIHYFASIMDDSQMEVKYGNPDPLAADQSIPYTVIVSQSDLLSRIEYKKPDWRPITRIEIDPIEANEKLIDDLLAAIAQIQHDNDLISIKLVEGTIKDTKALENQLERVRSEACLAPKRPDPNPKDNPIFERLQELVRSFEEAPKAKRLSPADLKTWRGKSDELEKVANSFYADNAEREMPTTLKLQIEGLKRVQAWNDDNDPFKVAQQILETIGRSSGHIPPIRVCHTLLHQVCYLSWQDYQYNINVPGQAAIQDDTDATILGLTGYIQPIWRPDTSYAIRYVLQDEVDAGQSAAGTYSYTFGFSTGGPVGYFHTNPDAHYATTGSIDQYPLTSLRQYIDYDRSYPNADGKLLGAKPLFYDAEVTRIDLYFSKVWARHFFHQWPAYNGQPAATGRMKIVIKDPAEGTEVVNPPYLDFDPADTVYTNIPQTVESWQDDPNPVVPPIYQQYQNLLDSQTCVLVGGQKIIPAAQFAQTFPKHLKPSKLYTAIVNNMYDVDKDGDLDAVSETREVHKFTFQTSRYKDFAEQINSYLLSDDTTGTVVTRPAIFRVDLALTAIEIASAYATITGSSDALADGLSATYQDKFDRVIEGLFKISPLDAARNTEFNVIRNSSDADNIVAVLIRNPEPLNNPRMPLADVIDTVSVLNCGTLVAADCHYLFSKDYSQVLIMNKSLTMAGPMDVRFQLKLWDGSGYVVPGTPTYTTDSVGTIDVTGLNIDDI